MTERFDAVLGALDAGVVIHAADTTILDANARARALLGISDLEGRLATDPLWQFMEADRTPMTLERFPVMQVLATDQPLTDLQMIVRPPAGPETWLEISAMPVHYSSGRLRDVVVTFIDVTATKAIEDRLREQAERLELVLYGSRLGLWDWNMLTGETVFDERWAEILGYRLRDLEPISIQTWERLAHPKDLASSREQIEAHTRGAVPFYSAELRMRHRDGHWVWVQDRGRLVERAADGRPLRMTGTHEDISERKRADAALRESIRRLEQTERIAQVGHWTLDLTTGQVSWSASLYKMFGLDPAGPPPDLDDQARLFTAASWHRLRDAVERTRLTSEPYVLDLEMVRRDGSTGWVEARGESIVDSDGSVVGLHGVSLDITPRKTADQRLHTLATRDALTGLANRASLLDELNRILLRASRGPALVAAMLMDLDHFKHVNDTFGHATGDELLIAAADRLRQAVRGGDLVARLGGDEFVVVMPDVADPREAYRAATRIVEAFRRPFHLSSGDVFSTVSVGLAFDAGHGDAGDLLRETDTAMYAAKEAGRDRVGRYDEGLRTAVSTRLGIETDLRRARESGELEVWYQPEVDLTTGSVSALEALLRWRRQDGEVWTAGMFVEIAEDSGLILEIGPWALSQACAQAADWARDPDCRTVVMRVNVSAVQLAEVGLLDDLDNALRASQLDPALLCIEITETALLHHTATVAANLAGIRARGVSIAIDDFGTGYASLTNLNVFPIDLVKIDSSFMTDPTQEQHDDRLVNGIIALATSLGIGVTAEGVEHPLQMHHLVRMGCTSAQGWLFSKAVPAHEATPLLHHGFRFPLANATEVATEATLPQAPDGAVR